MLQCGGKKGGVGDARQQAGRDDLQSFNLEAEIERRKICQENRTLAKLYRALGQGALHIRSKVHWQHSTRHRSGTRGPEAH